MAIQKTWVQSVGFIPTGATNSTATLALSAAATWLAISFKLSEDKTLSKVRARISAIAGSISAGNITCTLYNDSSGSPGTSIEVAPTNPTYTASAWNEWAGFTTALTAETMYWIVFKNLQGTPASNNPTFLFGAANTGCVQIGNTSAWCSMGKRQTADSGSTWTTSPLAAIGGGLRLEFNDGTFYGAPVHTMTGIAAASGVFGTREYGARFTTPLGTQMRITGIGALIVKTGTPTQAMRFRLYEGATLVATTNTIPQVLVTNNGYHSAYFSSIQTLKANTLYRIVVSEVSQSDTSANVYRPYTYTIENDANSKALFPWGWQRTETADATANPVVWTDTDTDIPIIYMTVDSSTNGEFSPVSAGMLPIVSIPR
jgi:hypothetical protein